MVADDPATLEGMGNIIGLILSWAYFSVMESFPIKGTLGKMAIGIKVTDVEGNKIGFGKAAGRYFGKIISPLILLMGFIMVAFTQKKKGLHDMMAGCLVVNKQGCRTRRSTGWGLPLRSIPASELGL
jgi:uncharacterized RDD family membrane protein YckC